MKAKNISSSPSERSADPLWDRAETTGRNLVYTATAALWMGCVTVGVCGLILHYPRPQLAAKEPPPVVAERIRVDLADNPLQLDSNPAASASPQTPGAQPPPPTDAAIPADAPPATPLAVPSPAIAFALPQAGLASSSQSPGAVHRLTFGVGQGAQAKPEYPRAAILGDEQGTVDVRFTVGRDGSVASAQLSPGCRWPLLNEAALRTIRDRWRFGPGPVRYYEVSIDFTFNEQ